MPPDKIIKTPPIAPRQRRDPLFRVHNLMIEEESLKVDNVPYRGDKPRHRKLGVPLEYTQVDERVLESTEQFRQRLLL